MPGRRHAARPVGRVRFATDFNHADADGNPVFWPYKRDPETLARPWAIPGTPGLMHRIGGIEKEDGSGNICYDPDNHERMVRLRAAKVAGIAKRHPAGDAQRRRRRRRDARAGLGLHVGRHRRRHEPRPRTGAAGWRTPTSSTSTRSRSTSATCSAATRRVLVPEMNLGQLAQLVRAEFLVDARSIVKVQGVAVHRRRVRAGHPRRPRRAAHDRRHRPAHDPEGLVERPGGPLVPRMRRLLDPDRRPAAACPSSGCGARTRSSSPASAAPPASRTT